MILSLIIYITIILSLTILSIYIRKDTDKESRKYKNMELSRYILITILVIYTIYIIYYYSSKEQHIARKMLNIKGKQHEKKFDKLCEKLFSLKPTLYEQFKQMKKNRPITELRTLCGNHAKNILKIKV